MTRRLAVMRLTNPPPNALAETLARAFFNEPNCTYLLPADEQRRSRLPWFFAFVLRLGLSSGEVYVTADGAGCAVWIGPGATVGLGASLQAGMFALPARFGWGGMQRSMRLGRAVAAARTAAAPRPHWYLMALGVEPAEQGRGVGGALLQPVLASADVAGEPCYLETFAERNLPFYQRHGFQVVTDGLVPEGGPKFWGLAREPRR